jgi:hypothetical protein
MYGLYSRIECSASTNSLPTIEIILSIGGSRLSFFKQRAMKCIYIRRISQVTDAIGNLYIIDGASFITQQDESYLFDGMLWSLHQASEL